MCAILRFVAIISAVILLSSAAYGATLGKAELNIDWSSFVVTPVPDGQITTPRITWENLYSAVNAYTSQEVYMANWTSPIAAHTGNTGIISESTANVTTLYAYAKDISQEDTAAGHWVSRGGEFSVEGTGNIELSVNYMWEATLLSNVSGAKDQSFVDIYSNFQAETRYERRENRAAHDGINIQLLAMFPSDIGVHQGGGTLKITVPVIDGDKFYFNLLGGTTANTLKPIPLPGSGVLLIFGLLTTFWGRFLTNCAIPLNFRK
ncbi:hypothetical protein [Methylococcus sp. EFPC2]|uniref:hypothetical protein n=1 Tax=Methylococcus sp. EFPC2 TaxID=2812648 RepID=UPI001967D3E4|nr:hypothetical protein [Methylococcus sp. EFPC2]QSA98936.1 hypothetical protein JWZ97_09240 [Methylococcus sp. EFPC2]